MLSTTTDAEIRRKSSRPAGCVEYYRSAASSFLDDICRLVTLPFISAILDTTRTFRFQDAFYGAVTERGRMLVSRKTRRRVL